MFYHTKKGNLRRASCKYDASTRTPHRLTMLVPEHRLTMIARISDDETAGTSAMLIVEVFQHTPDHFSAKSSPVIPDDLNLTTLGFRPPSETIQSSTGAIQFIDKDSSVIDKDDSVIDRNDSAGAVQSSTEKVRSSTRWFSRSGSVIDRDSSVIDRDGSSSVDGSSLAGAFDS